ncbi:biliverdin-producing heme oxygenase [Agrococcus sp. KRD186]|jgi:heme oxygenase|uniref:biliverdin-producing heme oxygenase n=1 Tax=Agrococcus sp. KRD186 TaxID=2729730 RepID=UPI0019D24979|nr:biliverdin-producing heme oxygenase [Agrococcus sp. KRD186]
MPQTSDLAARLRAATWSAHQSAAGDAFVKGLLRGERTVADYARLASQHLVIYRALEAAVAASGSGLAASLHDPALERVAAIEADLAALGGRADPTPATAAYARHLAGLAADPVRLAAHHYTRYLGDLSGGQHIGRALSRHFGEATTSFYRFAIDDLDAFKQQYRATLDAAGLVAVDERALLDEAAHAYAAAHAVHASLADEAAMVA